MHYIIIEKTTKGEYKTVFSFNKVMKKIKMIPTKIRDIFTETITVRAPEIIFRYELTPDGMKPLTEVNGTIALHISMAEDDEAMTTPPPVMEIGMH